MPRASLHPAAGASTHLDRDAKVVAVLDLGDAELDPHFADAKQSGGLLDLLPHLVDHALELLHVRTRRRPAAGHDGQMAPPRLGNRGARHTLLEGTLTPSLPSVLPVALSPFCLRARCTPQPGTRGSTRHGRAGRERGTGHGVRTLAGRASSEEEWSVSSVSLASAAPFGSDAMASKAAFVSASGPGMRTLKSVPCAAHQSGSSSARGPAHRSGGPHPQQLLHFDDLGRKHFPHDVLPFLLRLRREGVDPSCPLGLLARHRGWQGTNAPQNGVRAASGEPSASRRRRVCVRVEGIRSDGTTKVPTLPVPAGMGGRCRSAGARWGRTGWRWAIRRPRKGGGPP